MLHSMPSNSLPPPERPGSLQSQTSSLEDDKNVEEITRHEEARYTYSRIKEGEFRLLRLHPGNTGDAIHCSLVIDNVDTPSSYEALSYVWGAQQPAQNILLSDEIGSAFTPPTRFQVGPNLYSALHHLRAQDTPLLLWVDALCINQQDNEEKNHQIKSMGAIFSKAWNVVIYLGESDVSSRFFFSHLHRVFRSDFFVADGDNGNPNSAAGLVRPMQWALTNLLSQLVFQDLDIAGSLSRVQDHCCCWRKSCRYGRFEGCP